MIMRLGTQKLILLPNNFKVGDDMRQELQLQFMNHTNMKEQIIESEKRLLTAFQNNDTKILEGLLHDNLLFVIPTGQTITKTMDLENMRLGNMKVHSISSSEQQINLIGDNAIVSVLIELKGKYLEHPIDGKFRYIRVWKLIDDTWKVIGGSGVQILT